MNEVRLIAWNVTDDSIADIIVFDADKHSISEWEDTIRQWHAGLRFETHPVEQADA